MFYVHLFLKAMYRKEEINVVFPKSAAAYAWQFEVLKLRKAVASYVKQVEQTQRGGKKTRAEIKNCDCYRDELREGEINWQHVKEHTGEQRYNYR